MELIKEKTYFKLINCFFKCILLGLHRSVNILELQKSEC